MAADLPRSTAAATSLELLPMCPSPQQADLECVVECCSNLQRLMWDTWLFGSPPALLRLPGLTSLELRGVNNQQCRFVAQLTGLRELTLGPLYQVPDAGLRALTALEQLTSIKFLGDFSISHVSFFLRRQLLLPGLPGPCYSRLIVNEVCVFASEGSHVIQRHAQT